MVFTNLPEHEKDAFFNLLDEYFSSRPDIFRGENAAAADADDAGNGSNFNRGAAASAVHRALASNPEATSKLVSAGLNRGIAKDSPYASVAHNPGINNAVGRVAAASLAFNANKSPAPPPPPHRNSGSTSPGTQAEPTKSLSNADKPASSAMSRKFGDVDTSSAKGFYNSLRNSTANKSYTPPPPVIAPAFAPKKNSYAPPPTRRVASFTSEPSVNSAPHTPPAPPPPPARHQPPVEEEQGEWAEVLYDYDSTEAGDLPIRADQRVLITEKNSDDWWTGEADGKKGLFPAAYVKML